jgi:hypothetical protein
VTTRWSSFENLTAEKGQGGEENCGAKGHAFDSLGRGETKVLLDVKGSGTVRRMWITLRPRNPKVLRALRLAMFWDTSDQPAVSVPLGDFFNWVHGQPAVFENALFANPEGRSFVCFIPMPFRTAAKVTLTNESGVDIPHVFYDINVTMGDRHGADTLYFHASWRRERPTTLGEDFAILPRVSGAGRFLGCHVGVIANPAFYRYHIPDPVYFDQDCRVTVQQIGGSQKKAIVAMLEKGVAIKPISVDDGGKFVKLLDPARNLADVGTDDSWTNYYRRDDLSAVAFFYLDTPTNNLPPMPPADERTAAVE